MATQGGLKKAKEKLKEDIDKNPLLKLNLGELVQEMHKLIILDPNIISPEDEIPKESRDNYDKYQKLILELNRRERNYTSYKRPPIY